MNGQPILCLVEETRKLATIMAAYFKKYGFATIFATHGDEAERVILERRPDAVLLDVMLPGLIKSVRGSGYLLAVRS